MPDAHISEAREDFSYLCPKMTTLLRDQTQEQQRALRKRYTTLQEVFFQKNFAKAKKNHIIKMLQSLG